MQNELCYNKLFKQTELSKQKKKKKINHLRSTVMRGAG